MSTLDEELFARAGAEAAAFEPQVKQDTDGPDTGVRSPYRRFDLGSAARFLLRGPGLVLSLLRGRWT